MTLWGDVEEHMGLEGQHRESMFCVNQRKVPSRMKTRKVSVAQKRDFKGRVGKFEKPARDR